MANQLTKTLLNLLFIIDFGSKNIFVGRYAESDHIQNERVEIIDTKQGGVEAPMTISWRPGEDQRRLIGKNAFSLRAKNSKHTVDCLLRLVQIAQYEAGSQKYIAQKAHESKFANDEHHLDLSQIAGSGEVTQEWLNVHLDQLIGAYFKQLHRGLFEENLKIYLTYPSKLEMKGKQILKNAMQIASIPFELVPEDKAVIFSYIYSH